MRNKEETTIQILLSFEGEYIDAVKLINLIGFAPKKSWKKGDIVQVPKGLKRKDGRLITRENSYCEFDFGVTKSLDFGEEVEKVVNRLKLKIADIKDFTNSSKLSVVLSAVVWISESPSISINKLLIDFCHELDAEIDIDMYLNEKG